MHRSFNVDVQLLFLVCCGLKLALTGLGWVFDSVWIMGVALPLLVMGIYIFVGYNFRDASVTAEKFADSCYYMGFIFTIASIIVSLFDLHRIGDDLFVISLRFGAAMISTVAGLFVRVWMVSFRVSSEDAIQRVEDQVVDAANRLSNEFVKSFDALQHFRGEVMTAAKAAVDSVKIEFETIVANNTEQMDAYFKASQENNNAAFLAIIDDVKIASLGLSSTVAKYAKSSESAMQKADEGVGQHLSILLDRLNSLSFPDDLFAQKLEHSISRLRQSTESVNSGVAELSQGVQDAAKAVERTVTEINMKGNNLVQVLDVAENVADMQDKVLQVIERQGQSVSAQSREVLAIFQTAQNAAMDAQNQLFSRLEANTEAVLQTMESAARLSESLDKVIDRLWAGNELSEQLAVTVEQCQYDSNKTIEMLGAVITPVASLLSDSKVQNQQLITVLTANQQATRELFDRIGRSTQASEALMPQTIEKVEQGNAALHSQLVNIVSLLSRQAVANDSARVVALPAPAEKA
jgi:hypothetical protein